MERVISNAAAVTAIKDALNRRKKAAKKCEENIALACESFKELQRSREEAFSAARLCGHREAASFAAAIGGPEDSTSRICALMQIGGLGPVLEKGPAPSLVNAMCHISLADVVGKQNESALHSVNAVLAEREKGVSNG